LGLQTLAKAFQPGTERQVSKLFDDVFDHALRDPVESISSYITCNINDYNAARRRLRAVTKCGPENRCPPRRSAANANQPWPRALQRRADGIWSYRVRNFSSGSQ
jgi:hypothetical protein